MAVLENQDVPVRLKRLMHEIGVLFATHVNSPVAPL